MDRHVLRQKYFISISMMPKPDNILLLKNKLYYRGKVIKVCIAFEKNKNSMYHFNAK